MVYFYLVLAMGVTCVLHKGTNVLHGRVIMDPSQSTDKIIIVT